MTASGGAAREPVDREDAGRPVDEAARDLAVAVAIVADEKQGSDVVVLQVGEVLGVTEYFVIVSAPNRRLVKTLVDEIEEQARERCLGAVNRGAEFAWAALEMAALQRNHFPNRQA